jgi:hypothetical protein
MQTVERDGSSASSFKLMRFWLTLSELCSFALGSRTFQVCVKIGTSKFRREVSCMGALSSTSSCNVWSWSSTSWPPSHSTGKVSTTGSLSPLWLVLSWTNRTWVASATRKRSVKSSVRMWICSSTQRKNYWLFNSRSKLLKSICNAREFTSTQFSNKISRSFSKMVFTTNSHNWSVRTLSSNSRNKSWSMESCISSNLSSSHSYSHKSSRTFRLALCTSSRRLT